MEIPSCIVHVLDLAIDSAIRTSLYAHESSSLLAQSECSDIWDLFGRLIFVVTEQRVRILRWKPEGHWVVNLKKMGWISGSTGRNYLS